MRILLLLDVVRIIGARRVLPHRSDDSVEFSIKNVQPGRSKTGCVIVGVFEGRKLSAAAARLDANGQVAKLLRRGDMEGKSGTTLLLHNVPDLASERVL